MAGSIGPYRILRKLGSGGMGDVFLAEDERLGRRVALKCPSDAWLKTPDARARLQREARAAAQLHHPNIATVFDVIEEAGRPYIVMEYVEGESLSAISTRGPLAAERAVAIGIQIADGLAAAHAAGVIHRDLKPGNVMLTPAGQVKLLDFGVARFTTPGAEPLTAAGEVVGTPGYVAPEQLLGRPADERSDVYSAGTIVYQLIAGVAPWEAPGSGGSVEVVFSGAPNLRRVMPSVPVPVADVVMKAVSREPRDRYTSATDLRQALEAAAASLRELPTLVSGTRVSRPSARGWSWTVLVAVLVLLILAGMPYALRGRSGGSVTARTLPVVAVLPLDNLTGDPRMNYVGPGMADTISTKLSSVSGLAIVSRAEIHEALARTTDVSKVAQALGATYVVTGGAQQAGDRLLVTVNLLSPDGATIVSGDTYEDSASNLFALQRRIAEDLARRITGKVSARDHEQLSRPQTSNVTAIAAYWRGRGLVEQPGPGSIDSAIAAFTEATTADASFGLGYAGLGGAFWRKYEQTRDAQWAGKAVEANEHARQLAPDEAEVRLALATVYIGIGRSADAAEELTRTLAIQPTNDRAHRLLGDVYATAGKMSQAETEYAAAIRIRPEFWQSYRQLGMLQARERRFDDAAQTFRKITQLQPESPVGYQLLGYAHSLKGDFDAARADYEASNQRGGSFATSSNLGTIAYMQGRYADAVTAYRQAIAQRPNGGKTHWNLADAYRRAGDQAAARDEYARAAALFDADLAVNPKDAVARAVRATCLARLGRAADAQRESDRAIADAATNDEVFYQRALLLTIAGKHDAAVDALRESVKRGRSISLLKRDVDLEALKNVPGFSALVSQENAPTTARRNQ